MKRIISLIIAFALSFLMMFGSIAMAGEMKVQMTLTLPESTESEVVKVPPIETKKPNDPLLQEKACAQVLEKICAKSCGGTEDGCPEGSFLKRGTDNRSYCIPCVFFCDGFQ